MILVRRIQRSLALQQAAQAVLAACVIGLLLSSLEMGWVTWREREKADALTRQILDLVEGSAAAAAWNLDDSLAEQIGASALSIDAVAGIEIHVDGQAPLWSLYRLPDGSFSNSAPPSAAPGALGSLIFADMGKGQRTLFRPTADGAAHPPIGTLVIRLDASRLSADFSALLAASLLGGMVRNLLLGLALTLLFHRFMIRPMVAVAHAVDRINPGDPGRMRVPVPAGHEQDELGGLVARINSTLERLDLSQQALRNAATRDALTQLPNRALLNERLEHALARAARSSKQVAVLFLDLDRFKTVNDSLGHEIGDQFLRAVACRLRDTLRTSDTVGRLGGDEFLLIIDEIEAPKEAIHIADRVLAALARPLKLSGHQFHPTASIGMSLWPDDGQEVGALLRSADIAMYAAKNAGGACWRMFSTEMADGAMLRLRTEARLRAAELRGEFELFYQPKISPMDRSLTGVEALLRWRTEDGYVAPAQFIPLAEETGLIRPIGQWVLNEACRQAALWRLQHGDVPVAVNVSARQFNDETFPDRVASVLAAHDLPPSLLTLEITETMAMSEARGDFAILRRLHDIGVGLAIDDFGTGYSSLSHLRRMPLTVLKIDQCFMEEVPRDTAIAITILELGQRLGLEIVAEGVETMAQFEWLRQQACATIQGFLIAPPLPAKDLENRFLNQRQMVAG